MINVACMSLVVVVFLSFSPKKVDLLFPALLHLLHKFYSKNGAHIFNQGNLAS